MTSTIPPNPFSLGATPLPEGGTFFRVWAPKRRKVDVERHRGGAIEHFPLEIGENRYFSGTIEDASPGDRYFYRLDDSVSRPDPASRYQPEGIHGPSGIVDSLAFRWNDSDWSGIRREDLVIYEIHVGTFTSEGTFRAARHRLDELIDLGVTSIEIMPVAETPGRWNWGYDGVDFFAPSHTYGTPDDFKSFVDACHGRGIAVLLDVVYNHIGPEGNYLGEFGPYFSAKHKTPWGEAFNYEGRFSRAVRDFILANVRYWLDEFHLDGLRLDAIRLMHDDSEVHIVREIAESVNAIKSENRRPIHLIGESNVYDPGLLADGYDAIWSDELPNGILSVLLDRQNIGGRDYLDATDLKRCLRTGFLYRYQEGKGIVRDRRLEPADTTRLIQGLQTHDQVGNHPIGSRISTETSPKAQRAAAALILLYPSIPFIFMGEEFASASPFCFFADFGDHWLRKGVEEGRKRDYDHHDWSEFVSPLSEEAFLKSKLPRCSEGDPTTLNWYRTLLSVRSEWIAAGILRSENLSIEASPELGIFVLNYGDAWVAVRLSSRENAPEAIIPGVTGESFLHSEGASCERIVLSPNEAVIGRTRKP